jgi:hypothetical protein
VILKAILKRSFMSISESRFRQILREEARRTLRENDDTLKEGLFDFFTGGPTGRDWSRSTSSVLASAKDQIDRLNRLGMNPSRRWSPSYTELSKLPERYEVAQDFMRFVERDPPKGWFEDPVKKGYANAFEKYIRSGSKFADKARTVFGNNINMMDRFIESINKLTLDAAAVSDSSVKSGALWSLTREEEGARDRDRADRTSAELRAGGDLIGQLADAIRRAGGEAENVEAAQMLKARRRGDPSVTDSDVRSMISRLSKRGGVGLMNRIRNMFGNDEPEPNRGDGRMHGVGGRSTRGDGEDSYRSGYGA